MALKTYKLLMLVIAVAVTLLFFQNCGKFVSSQSTSSSSASSYVVEQLILNPADPLNANVQDSNTIQSVNAVIPIVLNRSDVEPVTITYQTSDGTAKEGVNYTKTTSTIVIPAGQTSANVLVPIVSAYSAVDLMFNLSITAVSKGTIGRAAGRFVIVKSVGPPPPIPALACGIQGAGSTLAFCDRFDKPSAVVGRSGQLDSQVWNVSRYLSYLNIGMPWRWATTQIDVCGVTQTVNSPNDVQICNGQLREATNDDPSGDGGGSSTLNMQIKQPFDFAGRTGTLAFDVSNDTAGTHAAWPEVWVQDQPVPSPYSFLGTSAMIAPNGFGVRFGGYAPAGQAGLCPSVEATRRFTVDSAMVFRNFLYESTYTNVAGCPSPSDTLGKSCIQGNVRLRILDCVKASSGPNGGLNHIELKISESEINVYATDAGTTAPLKRIAVIENASLNFRRGYVALSDTHFIAARGPVEPDRPTQVMHTFAWDNVGFDGPILGRDRSYDVPESRVPIRNDFYLGWSSSPAQPATILSLPIPVADFAAASTAALTFNFWYRESVPTAFKYRINNGVEHTYSWPYPDRQEFTMRSILIPIELSEIKPGQANQIAIRADSAMEVANVSILLKGAGGVVSPK